jgi:hypothetical protein
LAPIPVKPTTEGFTEHENLVQFSFPVIPSRYHGEERGKGGCFRKTSRMLARAGASFFETPSKQQRRNSLGNMPSTHASKKVYGFTNTKKTVHRLTFLTHISNTM